MIIAFNNIQRALRRKGFIFIFLMPIVFTAVYMMSANPMSYKLGVVDLDQSGLSEWLIEGVRDEEVIPIEAGSNEEYERLIVKREVDFLIVIDKDFEENVLIGKEPDLNVYYSEGNPIYQAPLNLVKTRVNSAVQLSSMTENKSEFLNLLSELDKGSFNKKSDQLVIEDTTRRNITAYGLGMLIMSMMFFSNSAAMKVNDDKKNGIYNRIMAGSVSRFRYSFEVIMSLLVMVVLKVLLVMLVIGIVLKGDFGPNPLNVFIVFSVFATVVVALTNLINSLSKDSRQANYISVFITTPLCMLGGCLWPISVTPQPMQYISNFVPTKWAMDAIGKAISGSSIMNMSLELGILLLFTLTLFIISSVKKVELSK